MAAKSRRRNKKASIDVQPRVINTTTTTRTSSTTGGDMKNNDSTESTEFSTIASTASVSSSGSVDGIPTNDNGNTTEWRTTPTDYVTTVRQEPSSSHSSRHSLVTSFLIFVLGIGMGILYERQLLTLGGPRTQSHHQQQQVSVDGRAKITTPSASLKKGIRLNGDSDNAQQQNALLPTLFGLDYHNVIAPQVLREEEGNNSTTTTSNLEQQPEQPATKRHEISSDWYNLASTQRPVVLASSETAMIQEISQRVVDQVPDLVQRAAQVSWGGPSPPDSNTTSTSTQLITNWWYPSLSVDDGHGSDNMNKLNGGQLLYSYLFIMRWNPQPHFPFRLCGGDKGGCPPERALLHTLEWREKYRPWLVPPSVMAENEKGYVYHRGFSPVTYDNDANDVSFQGRHGTVWVRVGHVVKDNLAFFRGILNAADRAIGQSLIVNKGDAGKFNVIFDCKGFSLSNTPTLHALKQGITMLQDHYPNRLGMIFLVHLSRPGEMFLKVVLRLITKEVRDKVKILPNQDKAKSMAILKMVVEESHIPEWLGGTDQYQFHAKDYYPPHHQCTEGEAKEFLTTMPYHAK